MHNDQRKIEEFKTRIADYLTFYHEIRTPEHPFFTDSSNFDAETPLLLISSPSRMGNHLLMSLLDSHPELPRIPGEDGFLSFSFFQANYDLKRYLERVRDLRDPDYIQCLSTNLFFDKWGNLKRCYEDKIVPGKYSGVNIKDRPADIDFQDTIYDVDVESYNAVLRQGLTGDDPMVFRDYLNLYLKAFLRLDFAYDAGASRFRGMASYSGMRSQARWVLEHYEQARLVTSLRPFETYAVSHIKSRNKESELTDELVQEAWEHWYHKVIDYLYLKAAFPEKVCLVSFDDLTGCTEQVGRGICRFLDISYNDSMCTPTVFGNPVKGNSFKARGDAERGRVYKSSVELAPERIPLSCSQLWKLFNLVKTV